MGAGKSAVLAEASDALALRRIVHAAVDLDALAVACLPHAVSSDDVMYRNLQAVCENYASLGVTRILLARALESRDELETCRSAVSAGSTVVCRLVAGVEAMQQRVKNRESGVLQAESVARVAILNDILDRVHLEDFIVSNQSRSVTEVAEEMLRKAAWISD